MKDGVLATGDTADACWLLEVIFLGEAGGDEVTLIVALDMDACNGCSEGDIGDESLEAGFVFFLDFFFFFFLGPVTLTSSSLASSTVAFNDSGVINMVRISFDEISKSLLGAAFVSTVWVAETPFPGVVDGTAVGSRPGPGRDSVVVLFNLGLDENMRPVRPSKSKC